MEIKQLHPINLFATFLSMRAAKLGDKEYPSVLALLGNVFL